MPARAPAGAAPRRRTASHASPAAIAAHGSRRGGTAPSSHAPERAIAPM